MDDFDIQIQCEEFYADGDQIDPREDFSRQLWNLIAEFINDRHLTADEVRTLRALAVRRAAIPTRRVPPR